MKFKVDENLPIEVAELFNQAGYEAETVHDENLVGEVDQKLAETCQLERRAIITLDMDFADGFPDLRRRSIRIAVYAEVYYGIR